jgi:uncharacterized short protein YbdD (DUF466 family)
VKRKLIDAWAWIRRLTGDDAYEQYIAHLQSMHPDRPQPSRAQFHREYQAEKWTGVKRCC